MPPLASHSHPAIVKVIALALTSIGSACASKPPLAMRAPDLAVSPGRLAVLEASVLVYQLGEADAYVSREWTQAAEKNLGSALRARASRNGAGIINPKGFDDEREYELFASWADLSLEQIDARAEGEAFPEVKSVTQWRYSRPLEPWRQRLGADHVLVTRFRAGYISAGQAAADAFGHIHRYFRRPQGIACVVSLDSGRIVWCARDPGRRDDLRSPTSAKALVDRLLAGLLPR